MTKKYYTLILVGYISYKALSTNVRKEDKVQLKEINV